MSDEMSLTEIIHESLAIDPDESNFEEAGLSANEDADEDNYAEDVSADEADDTESLIDELINGVDDEVEDDAEAEDSDDSEESEDEDDEDSDTDADDSEKFRVKVDGETLEVTLTELKAGYQRQADYTRKAQALSAERQELDKAISEYGDTLQTLEQLDSAWDDNPVQVLAHFASNTENPTQAVAMLIKELAVGNLLDRDFMEVFGITADVQRAWASEVQAGSARRAAQQTQEDNAQRLEEAEYDKAVQEAIAEYDQQIDDILDAEGIELTVKQRGAFRARLAGYAQQNDITNLRAAYKAMKFEDNEKKRQSAQKATARAKQKKAASVVTRSGSGAKGSAAVEDNEQDLSSIIRAAMREAGGDA